MALTHDDVRKILAILDASSYEEVHIELGDLKLDLRRHSAAGPAERERAPAAQVAQAAPPGATLPAVASAPAATPAPRDFVREGAAIVAAPMLGTFYRAPAPGAKPFVEVGDKVQPGDTVCLLEVMKLFNSLKAGATGTVEEILVDNATLVAHGQPLLVIRKEP